MVDGLDGPIQLLECGAERARQGIVGWHQGGPGRPEDSQIEFAIEESDLEAVRGDRVAMGAGDPMEEPLESEAAEIVGHLGRGIGMPEQSRDLGTQLAVANAAGEMSEGGERLKDRHDAGVTEAEGRDALPGGDRGLLELIERRLSEDAVLTESFDFQEFPIDRVPELVEIGEIGDRLADGEILGVVEGGLGPQGAFLFEVLLDVRRFVLDVEARGDALGDDASAVAEGRRWGGAVIRRGKSSPTRSGRPKSKFSRMTASKKWRPWIGRSKTWVRLTSSWPMVRRWS